MILEEVAKVDHRFPEACEEIKSTDPPAQNVVGPFGVITGFDGFALTVIVVGEEVAEQPFPSVYVTVYVPAVIAVIVCVVADVDHTSPDGCEAVKSTDPPAQKVVDPLGVIVGTEEFTLTVTMVAAEVAEQPLPFVYVTVYDPAEATLMD